MLTFGRTSGTLIPVPSDRDRLLKETQGFRKEIKKKLKKVLDKQNTCLLYTSLSDAISADLKKRVMKFVGTTIIYAYLQAVGVIWAHEDGCFMEVRAE